MWNKCVQAKWVNSSHKCVYITLRSRLAKHWQSHQYAAATAKVFGQWIRKAFRQRVGLRTEKKGIKGLNQDIGITEAGYTTGMDDWCILLYAWLWLILLNQASFQKKFHNLGLSQLVAPGDKEGWHVVGDL